jgi:Ca-activated chloride channel family protein
MDEAPPAPPPPKPTPTPAPDTSAGEEIGAEDVVRISSNLVTVPASVVDAQGRAIIDLKLEDFELRVDGQPRTISDLNRSEVPVTLALLFDNSQSLTAARDFEKQAAVRFFRSVIRPIDKAAIYSVATDVVLAQPLTNNVAALVRTIDHFGKPEGATRLLDGIAEAANYLRPYPGRKVIVIVSDGEDTLSEIEFDRLLRNILAADCQVYAVQTKQIEYAMLTGEAGNANIRALAAERRLMDLTTHTGGAVYTPLRTPDLDAAFTQISADLAQQYILSYYPTDDRMDGRFRIISVRVASRSNMRVRARRGYYPRRPNERVSYNVQTPVSSTPLASQQNSEPPQTPTSTIETVSPSVLSVRTSGSVPARSRRVGPAESGDDTETNDNVLAVVTVEETISKGDKAPVNSSETAPYRTAPSNSSSSGATPNSTNTPPVTKTAGSDSTTSSSAATASSTDKSPATKTEPPDTTTSSPNTRPVSGGVLNGIAISLPKPRYPAAAKNARASGVVTVEVLLDEGGKVVSARAVYGNPYLRDAAVEAARLARFSPTVLSGQPMRVSGVITYKFTLVE